MSHHTIDEIIRDRARITPERIAIDEGGRTWTYAELERRQLDNVLDMLDGRYPSAEFGELRSRLVPLAQAISIAGRMRTPLRTSAPNTRAPNGM